MNKLKVHLGKPEHGWVPVTIEHNSTKIDSFWTIFTPMIFYLNGLKYFC